MIKPSVSLTGEIKACAKLEGHMNGGIIKLEPELENLNITPSTEEQTFKSENYYGYDEVTVEGIQVLDTSDATATANDIIAPKTAYVNGEKITGTINKVDEININSDDINIEQSKLIFKGMRDDGNTPFLPNVGVLDSNTYQMMLLQDGIFYLITMATPTNSYDDNYSGFIVCWNGSNIKQYKYSNGTWIATSQIPNIKVERNNTVIRVDNIEFKEIIKACNFDIIKGLGTVSEQIYYPTTIIYPSESVLCKSDTLLNVIVDKPYFIDMIGLTADKIKEGENILGVIGTYDGSSEPSDIISQASYSLLEETSFNGTSTEFDTGIAQSKVSQTGLTLAMQLYPTQWSNYRGVFGLHGGNSQGIVGLQYENGQLKFCNIKANTVINVLSYIPVNTWITAIFLLTPEGDWSVYINNVLVGQLNAGAFSPFNNLIIGKAFASGERYFKGMMKNICVWERILTESEMSEYYAEIK